MNGTKKLFIPAGIFFIAFVFTNILRLITLAGEIHATISISWDFVLYLAAMLVLGVSLFTKKISRFTLYVSAVITFSLIFDAFSGIGHFFGYPRFYLFISMLAGFLKLAGFLFLSLFLAVCDKNENVKKLWAVPFLLTAASSLVSLLSLIISASSNLSNLLYYISGIIFLTLGMLFLTVCLKEKAYSEKKNIHF